MHIALIVPGFSAAGDDWCIPVVRDLVAGLAATHQVTVISLRYPARRASYRVAGAEVLPLGGGEARGLARLPLYVRAMRTTLRAHRRARIDVVHGLWAHEPGALAVLAGRLTATTAVVSLMGGELAAVPHLGYGGELARGNRWLTRRALSGADRVLAASRFVLEVARPLCRGGLSQIPLGVDLERFRPEPGARWEGPVRLLSVGSLVPVKGLELVLEAFSRLPHGSAHLDVVGDGPLRAALERQTRELGCGPAVTFHGEVRHERLNEHYRRAEALVVGSWWESGPMVALEAAACSIGVVGTRVGLLPELGEGARCVAVGDVDALAAVLAEVVADRSLRQRMGAAALGRVRANFSMKDCVAAHGSLYAELAGGRGGQDGRRIH